MRFGSLANRLPVIRLLLPVNYLFRFVWRSVAPMIGHFEVTENPLRIGGSGIKKSRHNVLFDTSMERQPMSHDTSHASSLHSASDQSIRPASYADIPVLAALLGQSLKDDPLFQWIFLNNGRREKQVIRDFSRLLKPCIHHGVVSTIERVESGFLRKTGICCD